MKQIAAHVITAALYGLVLPFVGFAIFTLMTFFPLLGILLGPVWLAKIILTGGLLPSALTALVFVSSLRNQPLRCSVPAIVIVGNLSAYAWYRALGVEALGLDYFTFALFVATTVSVILIPIFDRGLRAYLTRKGFDYLI